MKTFLLFVLGFTALGFMACTCRDVDCSSPETVAVSFTDTFGNNLYALGVYHKDSLQIFAHCTCGAVDPFPKIDDDGTARFHINIEARYEAYIFRHNATERDTLFLNTEIEDSRCCGDIAQLRSVTYRGREIPVSALSNLVIRKNE